MHVVAERNVDLTALLRQVGGRTTADAGFPLPHGRGDETMRGGGTDARDASALGRKARDIDVPDLALGSGIKVWTPDVR